VQQFRYYCLSDADHIIFGADLSAPDLCAAIAAAHGLCGDHPRSTSGRIEIWQGGRRLYASPATDHDGPDNGQISR
jgi:hypothetical protein